MLAADLTQLIGFECQPSRLKAAQEHAELALERLDRLMAHLEVDGFRIDMRQRVAAHRVIISWYADRALGDLTDLLAPVFSRSAEQQQRFRQAAAHVWTTTDRLAVDCNPSVKTSTRLSKKIISQWQNMRFPIPLMSLALIGLVYGLWPTSGITPPSAVKPPVRDSITISQEEGIFAKSYWITFDEHFVVLTLEKQPVQRRLAWVPISLFLVWLIGWRLVPALRWLSEEESETVDADPGWLPLPGQLRDHLLLRLNKSTAASDWQNGRQDSTNVLEVESTIDATVREGGALVPVYMQRSLAMDSLFLIERSSRYDHVASLFDLIIQRLRDEGVSLERFFYRDDPRFLEFPESELTIRLKDVAFRYRECRLAVIATADGFFHPLTGEPENWLENLSQLKPRILLNTRPIEEWSWREMDLFERGFSLAIAGSRGLERTGQMLEQQRDHTPAMLGVAPLAREVHVIKRAQTTEDGRDARLSYS